MYYSCDSKLGLVFKVVSLAEGEVKARSDIDNILCCCIQMLNVLGKVPCNVKTGTGERYERRPTLQIDQKIAFLPSLALGESREGERAVTCL